MEKRGLRCLVLVAASLGVTTLGARDRPIGVVVESVDRNGSAAAAGVEPGDLLLSWRLPGSGGGRGSGNHLRDPLDLQLVALRYGSRGQVRLSGFRSGREIHVGVKAGEWGIQGRPQLSRTTLPVFTAALEAAQSGRNEAAADSARAMASEAASEGETRLAAWLLQRVGSELAGAEAWEEAADLYRESIAVLAPCSEPAVCALAHHGQAIVAAAEGRGDQAAVAFQAALDQWAMHASGELGAAATQQAWAESLERAGDLDGAADRYRRALSVRDRLAPGRLAVAESQLGLAGVHVSQGDLGSARRELERARTIAVKRAPESLLMVSTLGAQGRLALAEEEPDLARERFQEGLALVESLAPGSAAEARIVSRLAEVVEQQGRTAEAEELYRRAVAVLEHLGSEELERASCLERLGRVVDERGDLADAAVHLRKAVEIRLDRAPATSETADVMGALGRVELARGHGVEAREWMMRALALFRGVSPEAPAVVQMLESLAGVASMRGEISQAEELLLEALAHPSLAASNGDRAALMELVAQAAEANRDLEAARTWYEQARDLREEIEPSGLDGLETTIALGRLNLEQGDLEAARGLLEPAAALAENAAPGTLVQARIMRTLAEEQISSGELERAIELSRAAVAICEVLAPDSAELARSLHALARALRAAGEVEEAWAQATLAAAALERQKASLAVTIDQPTSAWLDLLRVYRELLDLLMESDRAEDALRVLEQSHAWRMTALMSGRELSLEGRLSPDAERRWRIARTSYHRVAARLAASSVPDAGEEPPPEKIEFDEARRELGAARAAVASGARELMAALEPGAVGVARASQLAGQGTLLLAWAIGEERSYLFAIGPAEGVFATHRLAIGRAVLAADVERLRELVKTGEEGSAELREVADRLGGLLLSPVSEAIDSAERLLLVADGPLRRLPFTMLTDRGPEGDVRYLVERAPFGETVSAGLLGDLGAGRARDQAPAILVVADPVAAAEREGWRSAAVAASVARGLQLEPVPESVGEAEAVASLFPDLTSTWVGEDVSEMRVAGLGRKPSVVHLGVRAFSDDRNPLESSLLLSLPASGDEGLGDGLLQAWEVLEGMRLDAFLVTLSRSGSAGRGGDAGAGEAVLTRALQFAGTRTVVVSSWEPDGSAATELMRRFYSNLGRGLHPDQALREAQLELLRGPLEVGEGEDAETLDLTHPVNWAGFRVVGDPR